jgi:glycopeptide antibiotics resistance protein
MIILLLGYASFIAQVTWLNRGPEGTARVFDTKWLWIDGSMEQNITNLLNVALFIPFGILITGIQRNKKSMRRILMTVNYCFLTSFFIECTQFITRRGYFEIDDLETNIIGGLTGSIFFSLFSKIGGLIYKRNTEVKNEKETQARNV